MPEELTGHPLQVLRRWIAEAGAVPVTTAAATTAAATTAAATTVKPTAAVVTTVEPTAAADSVAVTMTLATADADGVPHARTVVITTVDQESLRFHSSRPTGKTADLVVNPRVSGVFHWPVPGRQVVLHGTAAELDDAVSRAAFPTRPEPLQRLAWAYEELLPGLVGPDRAVAPGAVERAFAAGRVGEMPPSWTSIRLLPHQLDFWQAGTDHTPPTRTRFVRHDDGWHRYRILP